MFISTHICAVLYAYIYIYRVAIVPKHRPAADGRLGTASDEAVFTFMHATDIHIYVHKICTCINHSLYVIHCVYVYMYVIYIHIYIYVYKCYKCIQYIYIYTYHRM